MFGLFSKRVKIANAVVGDVFKFWYGKNESVGDTVRTGRIVDVRDTVKNPVRLRSKRQRPYLHRSRMLLTVREACGQYRKFYAEDVAESAVKLGKIRLLLLRLFSKKFAKAG